MSEGVRDLAEADPFVVEESAAETGGEYVRFRATVLPPPGEELAVDPGHERWGLDNGQEHVHPEQEEWFEVLSGELRVAYEGTERTLAAGEEIALPENRPHRHWNPTAEPVRVLWERRPAGNSETWLETAYALAQAGRTDADGTPGLLQTAVTFDEYPDDTYLTSVPVGAQKAMISLLAPVGRLAGYEAALSREDVGDGG